MVYVDAFGEVSPCVFTPMTFGNVRERPLGEILADMRRAFRPSESCFIRGNYRLVERLSSRGLPLDRASSDEVVAEARFGPAGAVLPQIRKAPPAASSGGSAMRNRLIRTGRPRPGRSVRGRGAGVSRHPLRRRVLLQPDLRALGLPGGAGGRARPLCSPGRVVYGRGHGPGLGMARRPADLVYPRLLALAKIASSVLSLGFFVLRAGTFVVLVNGVVDGLIGLFVLWLSRPLRRRTGTPRREHPAPPRRGPHPRPSPPGEDPRIGGAHGQGVRSRPAGAVGPVGPAGPRGLCAVHPRVGRPGRRRQGRSRASRRQAPPGSARFRPGPWPPRSGSATAARPSGSSVSPTGPSASTWGPPRTGPSSSAAASSGSLHARDMPADRVPRRGAHGRHLRRGTAGVLARG